MIASLARNVHKPLQGHAHFKPHMSLFRTQHMAKRCLRTGLLMNQTVTASVFVRGAPSTNNPAGTHCPGKARTNSFAVQFSV
eukprot:1483916-Alexandrium_andersonii.AAC.1